MQLTILLYGLLYRLTVFDEYKGGLKFLQGTHLGWKTVPVFNDHFCDYNLLNLMYKAKIKSDPNKLEFLNAWISAIEANSNI